MVILSLLLHSSVLLSHLGILTAFFSDTKISEEPHAYHVIFRSESVKYVFILEVVFFFLDKLLGFPKELRSLTRFSPYSKDVHALAVTNILLVFSQF